MKQTATAILINTKGEFVLQKRDNKPNIAEPGKVVNFGGSVEDGEDPKMAMIRELKEELNLDIKPNEVFEFDVSVRPNYFGEMRIANTFFIEGVNSDNLVLNEGEAIIFIKIGDDLDSYNLSEGTKLAINMYIRKYL